MTFWNPTRLIALNFYPFNFDLVLNWELDSTSTGPSFGCLMWPLGGASFTAPISPIFVVVHFRHYFGRFQGHFFSIFPRFSFRFSAPILSNFGCFSGSLFVQFLSFRFGDFWPFFGLFGPNFQPFRHISIILAPIFTIFWWFWKWFTKIGIVLFGPFSNCFQLFHSFFPNFCGTEFWLIHWSIF